MANGRMIKNQEKVTETLNFDNYLPWTQTTEKGHMDHKRHLPGANQQLLFDKTPLDVD